MAAPHSSVVAGLTALNQGDYHKAIAQLEAVVQNYNDPTTLVKVQMGLVIAYKNIGDERAIALCQTLSHHPDPQIQTWAVRHLQELNHPSQQLKPTQANQSDRTSLLEQNSATPATPLTGYRAQQRLKKLQRLPQINLLPLWLLQAGTAIAFFWLIRELLQVFMGVTNDLLVNLPYLEPIQLFYRDPTQFVLVTLFVLLSVSPWLLDRLLQVFYGLQPLSLDTLTSHSPEARQLLERYSQRQNWQVPQLRLLPISVPLALTYGNLPRNARIVVTQGLLEHLAANEIATIYATQLGHIVHNFALMSLTMAVTQLPYIAYCQISQWGNKISCFYLRFIAGVIANFAYVVWYLLCIPAVWLSQVRIYYSDRLATEMTGNPNGLTRALLKITQGVAIDIQQQECTSWLLESWQLLVPINQHQAITLSPCKTSTDFESVLTWDCCHPYRYWFSLNQTHPLVGDRLQRLAHIAQNWSLKPELAFLRTNVDSSSTFVPFLRQGAPFFGIILGLIFGCLTWLIGAIGIWLRIPQLAWMFGDWFLILGFLPIGFSIGTFIRINYFFPDSNFSNSKSDLLNFLSNPNMLPLNSQPLRLQGKLLGRRGISNWLAPVLILELDIGLIRLHQPLLKLIDTLLNNHSQIEELIGQYIVVTGWCRRGATLWLDLDTWHQTRSGRSYHPVWSTILACAAAIWGAYIILQGGTK